MPVVSPNRDCSAAAPTPIVKMRSPVCAASRAASSGGMTPASLPPSVSRMSTDWCMRCAAGALTLAQLLDRETDGIADRRLRARDADHGLVQELVHGGDVGRERRLQIGLRAEENQPDLIAAALLR